MANQAMDLVLWEGVRDGDLKRAEWALEQGADPNRQFCISKDNFGRISWDFSETGYLPWRHILITSIKNMNLFQPPTRSVPTVPVSACNGDTLMHISVKLEWHELANLLAKRVEINEHILNDDGKTPQIIAKELDRSEFYHRYFIGENQKLICPTMSNNLLESDNNITTVIGSPLRIGRDEFQKSAFRSLDREKVLKHAQFASSDPSSHLAGHVEQKLFQLELSPAPNDETVIPRFPRGQRVPVELPTRSWRAPTLNESAITFKQSSLPSTRDLLQTNDEDIFHRAIRDLKGKRFMMLRPQVCLVHVVDIHQNENYSLTSQPFISSETNAHELHLLVTYQVEGDEPHAKHTKPLGWFRANSRLAAAPKVL